MKPRALLGIGVAAALAFLGGAPLAGQQQPPQAPAPPPVFRAGVALVTTDVTVLDKQRRPVHGLTPADFVVTENGVPQTIRTFTEVHVPPPDLASARWTLEAGVDVATNTLETRRLVVIVMNDAATGINHGEPKSAIATANAIIDQLGPSDLATVVHTYLGRMENFTTDRAKLRAAANSFLPQVFGGGSIVGSRNPPPRNAPIGCAGRGAARTGCIMGTLLRVAEVLQTGPAGRKIVFFISPPTLIGHVDPDVFTALSPIRTMFEALQAANATVYEVDPRGLVVAGGVRTDEIGIAESTGGRRVWGDNEPELVVPEIFTEASSYYLIGYESTNTQTDGRFRRVRIDVQRPGTEVVARTGYYGPSRPRRTPAPRTPAPSSEEQALGRSLPSGDLPLRVTAAAFGVPGKRNAEVVAVVALREPPAGPEGTLAATRRVNLITAAFDTVWRQRGGQRQVIDLGLEPTALRETEYEITTRLTLPPGRYEFRVAAERLGRAGNLFLSLDVPDFTRQALSLSDMVVATVPAPGWSGGATVSDLLPAPPTIRRTFTAQDRAMTFLRVYQGGSRPVQPVTMTSLLRDSRDLVVATRETLFDVAAFSQGRSAEYRFDLPTTTLARGEYLLTLTASMGDKRVNRGLRFSVE